MIENFMEILLEGGKSNSLGRVNEVIELVLADKSRLEELYDCIRHEDAWVRMRAIDAFEKICRQHPDWIEPYVDKMISELSSSNQASIQWHLAEIYRQVKLTDQQKRVIIKWLEELLSTVEADWIAAANSMDTLMQFTRDGSYPENKLIKLLETQQKHRSTAVIKRATKHLNTLTKN